MRKLHKIGLTLGKFMPLHKGHETMIEFGSRLCDTLYVHISGKETDIIPFSVRVQHLKNFTRKFDNVTVLVNAEIANTPEPKYDENGVAIDGNFWKVWRDELISYNAEAVFTNDFYGKRLASELKSKWYPIDVDRQVNQISGTLIRNNPQEYYSFISDSAKGYFQQRIAIVGPESTGKSTLTKRLSEYFQCGYVNEYGRTLSQVRNNQMDLQDFEAIIEGQQILIESQKQHQRVFVDTESYTTQLYVKEYLDKEYELSKFPASYFQHYILLAPTIESVDDGTRVMSEESRWNFYHDMMYYLNKHKVSYVEIESTNWNKRTDEAIQWCLENLNER